MKKITEKKYFGIMPLLVNIIAVAIAAAVIVLAVKHTRSMENILAGKEAVIREKEQIIQENELRSQENLRTILAANAELAARSCIVTAADLNEHDFPQPLMSGDERVIEKYGKDITSPEDAVKAFETFIKDDMRGDLLFAVPGLSYVSGRHAAVMEVLAKKANCKLRTAHLWDMKKQTRFSRMILEKADGSIIPVQEPEISENTVIQNMPVTTVFPFKFDMMTSAVRQLGSDMELPAGGLYIHYYRVFGDGRDWQLSYAFSENGAPEDYNLRLLPLTTDISVENEISENIQTFKISPRAGGDMEFLVIADKVFIPSEIKATPLPRVRRNP